MIDKKVLEKFQNILKKEQLKLTKQRIAVLANVVNNRGHRECDEIYDQLKSDGENVSRATVYRTIAILEKYAFLRKLELGDGRARYESKVNSPHHDHLICTSCGKIVEFIDQDIEDLQEKIAKNYHFNLQRHIHQLFGICKKCR